VKKLSVGILPKLLVLLAFLARVLSAVAAEVGLIEEDH